MSNMSLDVEPCRQLRLKDRRMYKDAVDEEDIEGKRSYDVQEKLSSDKFLHTFVNEHKGAEITLDFMLDSGFTSPMVIKDKTGLGLRVPSSSFTTEDVKRCIGSRRVIDVMDVKTQTGSTMTMKEFVKYFTEVENRGDRLLNVLSLEFSHSRLETYVDPPEVVKQLDWVNLMWPQHLKQQQNETTNLLEKMRYPKVQRYCLMSVEGCYTDFHIDMGGTSVWYHILHGQKVFWLIPPTPENLQAYREWTLSGNQGDVFLGDIVPACQRIVLEAGWTFLIPSGWIHAVYTPKDSLVFGGNFLHSLAIPMQLGIWEIENRTHVPHKFRYPFFTEIHWYTVERYVDAMTGIGFRVIGDEEEKDDSADKPSLSQAEVDGLAEMVIFLRSLAPTKRSIPSDIINPDLLLTTCQELIESCDPETKSRFLVQSAEKKIKLSRSRSSKPRPVKSGGKEHRKQCRRVRCKQCEPCTRDDCELCHYCKDMRKFGGPGIMKQCCLSRQCLAPCLPKSATCVICEDTAGSELRECTVCYQITHISCAVTKCEGSEGIDNEDLPNSWECPQCLGNNKGVKRPLEDDDDSRIIVQKFVVRPAPMPPPPTTVLTVKDKPHTLDHESWTKVFEWLPPADLTRCLSVCKVWYQWVMDHRLWTTVDVSGHKVTKNHLIGIVRRQPRCVDLSGCLLSAHQLSWLLPRLPTLQTLHLSRLPWSVVLALAGTTTTRLHSLSIAWIGISDLALAELFTSYTHTAGIKKLDVSGSDISDMGIDLLACHCPNLKVLALSGCLRLSDCSVKTVVSWPDLRQLDLSHCHGLTAQCLAYLEKTRLRSVKLDGSLDNEIIHDFAMANCASVKAGVIIFR